MRALPLTVPLAHGEAEPLPAPHKLLAVPHSEFRTVPQEVPLAELLEDGQWLTLRLFKLLPLAELHGEEEKVPEALNAPDRLPICGERDALIDAIDVNENVLLGVGVPVPPLPLLPDEEGEALVLEEPPGTTPPLLLGEGVPTMLVLAVVEALLVAVPRPLALALPVPTPLSVAWEEALVDPVEDRHIDALSVALPLPLAVAQPEAATDPVDKTSVSVPTAVTVGLPLALMLGRAVTEGTRVAAEDSEPPHRVPVALLEVLNIALLQPLLVTLGTPIVALTAAVALPLALPPRRAKLLPVAAPTVEDPERDEDPLTDAQRLAEGETDGEVDTLLLIVTSKGLRDALRVPAALAPADHVGPVVEVDEQDAVCVGVDVAAEDTLL